MAEPIDLDRLEIRHNLNVFPDPEVRTLISALRVATAALKPVNKALETLMDEVTHKRATDWGLVNDTATGVTRALAQIAALVRVGEKS